MGAEKERKARDNVWGMRVQIGRNRPRATLKFARSLALDMSSIDPSSLIHFFALFSSLLFISSSALSSTAHLLTCSPARQPVTNYSLSYLLTSEMPPLRKDRAQASSRRQYDNTLQFNTFINVSIPKAPQVLSEEAIQLRPTIPAKTVRDLSIPYHITLKCTPPARRIALRYCLCLPLTPETRFGRTKGQLAHPQEACRSHQPPSKCIHPLQVPPFHLSS
jgi:hypothetical protein